MSTNCSCDADVLKEQMRRWNLDLEDNVEIHANALDSGSNTRKYYHSAISQISKDVLTDDLHGQELERTRCLTCRKVL